MKKTYIALCALTLSMSSASFGQMDQKTIDALKSKLDQDTLNKVSKFLQDYQGAADAEVTHRDVVYRTVGGERLLVDIYMPKIGEGPFPAVLIAHGGGWRAGDKTQLSAYARALAGRGYVAFCINYRLAPTYRHPAQIEDCRAAFEWIKKNASKYKVDVNKIGAVGYSAGAHLVTLMATTGSDLKAVAAGGTPCDLRDWGKGLEYWLGPANAPGAAKVREEASPITHVSKDTPPIFFWHGQRDTLVPRKPVWQMRKKLKECGVDTQVYISTNKMVSTHLGAPFDKRAQKKAWNFLDQYLK